MIQEYSSIAKIELVTFSNTDQIDMRKCDMLYRSKYPSEEQDLYVITILRVRHKNQS